MIHFSLLPTINENLKIYLEDTRLHYRNLKELKSSLNERKGFLLNDTTEKLLHYSCPIECLTINKIDSRNRFEKNILTFFITESRNKLKNDLKNLISFHYKIKKSSKIQIIGPAGIGKSYGIADFVVTERIMNADSNNHLIFYHHFNEETNLDSHLFFGKEIVCQVYPLIEKDFNNFVNSRGLINIEENSLLHLILKIFDEKDTNNIKNIYYLIFQKIKSDFPEKEITVVFDQVNEVEKIPKEIDTFLEPEDYLSSKNLFKAILKMSDKINFNFVICASNNNKFNLKNLLENKSHFEV